MWLLSSDSPPPGGSQDLAGGFLLCCLVPNKGMVQLKSSVRDVRRSAAKLQLQIAIKRLIKFLQDGMSRHPYLTYRCRRSNDINIQFTDRGRNSIKAILPSISRLRTSRNQSFHDSSFGTLVHFQQQIEAWLYNVLVCAFSVLKMTTSEK